MPRAKGAICATTRGDSARYVTVLAASCAHATPLSLQGLYVLHNSSTTCYRYGCWRGAAAAAAAATTATARSNPTIVAPVFTPRRAASAALPALLPRHYTYYTTAQSTLTRIEIAKAALHEEEEEGMPPMARRIVIWSSLDEHGIDSRRVVSRRQHQSVRPLRETIRQPRSCVHSHDNLAAAAVARYTSGAEYSIPFEV
ncbi:unnamed protein product [Trichogramma brassicae]|uniref:Uncharacterized protein n=1 Tax=Trichogramma brassicae TaxID=86971 RepID=A0A6H5J5D5_9HYME|nr:unnamed protein product [Trichogramma brassicae]